ncbi:glycosyltransferase [Halococcus agarilyticus]|uniref:glycosyltransferase n=1 Tax=Halococcus agarilyticus TaxID=1232219 RepID=UPI000677BE04|nr:glycosyltransferase [Halococcus agarilyticus]
MHVCLLLAGTFPPDERTRSHAAALREAGHTVSVVCRGGPREAEHETIDQIDVRRVSDETLYAGVRGTIDGAQYALRAIQPAWLRAIDAIDEERAIDACCVMDLRLVRTGLRAGGAHDVSVVADLPGNAPALERRRNRAEGWGDRLRSPRTLARRLFLSPWRLGRLETGPLGDVDRLVTSCEEARARYVREVGIDPERVAVVRDTAADPNAPIEIDDHGLGFDPDVTFVVTAFVGEGPDYDLETLVAAAARAADEAVSLHLVLVGDLDPETADALETQARRAVAGGRLTFRTATDPDRVPVYVAASDVCVFPARPSAVTETAIPSTAFRAMAMGVPVIATDVGPTSRIVRRTNAGRVVPVGDHEALTAALVALADSDTAAEYRSSGRRAVESRYHRERDAARLASLYESLSRAELGSGDLVGDLRAVRRGGSTAP